MVSSFDQYLLIQICFAIDRFVDRYSKMHSVNWERLKVLKAVLEAGSLAEAARRLGVSQPTVGRQIRALEKELDQTLIDMAPDGAFPTSAAIKLVPALDEMSAAARNVLKTQDDAQEHKTVCVTCGPWMASYLSRHLSQISAKLEKTTIEIVSNINLADLPRREADVAIRNKRPKSGRVRVKGLPGYTWAVYGAAKLVRGRDDARDNKRYSNFDWVTLSPELSHFPSARWLSPRLKKTPIATFNHSTNLLDAIRGGAVLGLIPCFAGDLEKGIVRLSKPFEADYDGHWMVLAEDIGRRPAVRSVADAIANLLEAKRSALTPVR